MVKFKSPLIFAAIILAHLCFANVSFAIQNVDSKCIYPDYSKEFCGKDTCEKFNRKLFTFNLKLNKYVVRPINIVWASVMPQYGMDRVKNFYSNINYPVRAVSCLVQKDFKASRQETLRFFTNTTIGFAGLYDPAKNIFKIEPRQEDMGQALASRKIKSGPYLVLPVVRGSVRDLFGQLLDCPLKPFSYIPIAGGIATAVCTMNNMTYTQPLIKKVEESYADPYQIVKQIDGISRYISNSNLDRSVVFREKTASQEIVKIKTNTPATDPTQAINNCFIKPDMELCGYNPQTPLIDSFRTVLFEDRTKKAVWSETSVWNKSFDKKIKTASINIEKDRPNYKYRYILQKNKPSSLAIIFPSIGESINSDHSTTLAEILYKEGYSVLILGSSFHWEFVKSMPKNFKPGLPEQDAQYARTVSAKIIDDFKTKKNTEFGKKILIGSSFGALTTLYTAAQEASENKLGISKYIALNPPIELVYALKELDKYCKDWKNDSSDIKLRAAITAGKVLQVAQIITNKESKTKCESLPFTDDEAKLIIGFIMKQKLSDVVFSIENRSKNKPNSDFYNALNELSFSDYGEKYIFVNQEKTQSQYDYEASLYTLEDFFKKNNNYKIYHTVDDYFANQKQIAWLKNQTGEKTMVLSNGSHLGFLYRKEFLDEFKKDIKLETKIPEPLQTVNNTIYEQVQTKEDAPVVENKL